MYYLFYAHCMGLGPGLVLLENLQQHPPPPPTPTREGPVVMSNSMY